MRNAVLDRATVADLANAAGPGHLTVLTLAYTGIRWGELAALRVSGVDLIRRRIHIAESVTEVAGGRLDWGLPKTHERRWVPVPRFLIGDLTAHVSARDPENLVFTWSRGAVLRVGGARRSWFDHAVRVSGVPEGFHPHELRHTAASLAVSAGANVKAVQRMLGHAKASMTLDVYADLSTTILKQLRTDWTKSLALRTFCGLNRRFPGLPIKLQALDLGFYLRS